MYTIYQCYNPTHWVLLPLSIPSSSPTSSLHLLSSSSSPCPHLRPYCQFPPPTTTNTITPPPPPPPPPILPPPLPLSPHPFSCSFVHSPIPHDYLSPFSHPYLNFLSPLTFVLHIIFLLALLLPIIFLLHFLSLLLLLLTPPTYRFPYRPILCY